MIDWVSLVAPCAHAAPIYESEIVCVTRDGEIEWKSRRSRDVAGSYESAVQVRTFAHAAEPFSHIEISGNPAKWFQGHNLFGTDDLHGLVVELLHSLAAHPALGLTPSLGDFDAWVCGSYSLTRVDVTDSFALDTRAQVLEWLRAAEQTAHLAHRGRGQLVKGSTLYFGQHSRRWALKLYSKGQEIEAHARHQPALAQLPHARAWAEPVLRAELVLRSMELKRMNLDQGAAWVQRDGLGFDPLELLRERMGALSMTTTRALSAEVLETLRPALRMAVAAWESGADLRVSLPRATFYKFRAELLQHGIDIATLQPRDATVIPIVRVLEAKPLGVPAWAVGTPLYFEPRRRVA